MIYLDNAATTLVKPREVAEAVFNAIDSKKFANPSRGSHGYSINALELIYNTREKIADFFGIEDPLKVVLTPNVTTGLNLAIKGLFSEGNIITSMAEHNSVLRPLYQFEESGGNLSLIPLDSSGRIMVEKLEELLKPDTVGVVVNQCGNVSGIVTDLDPIYDFCIEHELILIIDGAQGAGAVPTNFSYRKFPRTVYGFTGHKSLYGPQGTGGLLFIGDFNLKQVFTGGSGINSYDRHQPNFLPDIFEYGTMNVHSNAGLIEGISYLENYGMEKVSKKLMDLTDYFYEEVSKIDGIVLYNRPREAAAPIVSLNLKDYSSAYVSDVLWNEYEIATRPGAHCAPLYHKSMGTVKRGMVRFSFSTFTEFSEIDRCLEALRKI